VSPLELARQARTAAREAEQQAVALFRAAFPVGAPVSWKRGAHVQRGWVYAHGYGDSLTVRNTRTGRTLKVSHYDVFEGDNG